MTCNPALYARVSNDRQAKERTIDSQLDALFAENRSRNEWTDRCRQEAEGFFGMPDFFHGLFGRSSPQTCRRIP